MAWRLIFTAMCSESSVCIPCHIVVAEVTALGSTEMASSKHVIQIHNPFRSTFHLSIAYPLTDLFSSVRVACFAPSTNVILGHAFPGRSSSGPDFSFLYTASSPSAKCSSDLQKSDSGEPRDLHVATAHHETSWHAARVMQFRIRRTLTSTI